MNTDQEPSVRVGEQLVWSCVGRETGENSHVERDVIGGWPKEAAADSVYSITINPESPQGEEISYALHQALHISGPDANDLLEGRVAVLMELDGSHYFLLVGFLRALGLYFSVATQPQSFGRGAHARCVSATARPPRSSLDSRVRPTPGDARERPTPSHS